MGLAPDRTQTLALSVDKRHYEKTHGSSVINMGIR